MNRVVFPSLALVAFGLLNGACAPTKEAHSSLPELMPAARVPQQIGKSVTAAAILAESAVPFGFERIAKYPEPGLQVPRAIKISPDGKLATYLKSENGTETMSLFALDLATGAENVLLRASDLGPEKKASQAEELRDERQRKRIKGITEYAWAEDANVMIVPAEGDVFLRSADGKITQLTQTPQAEIDPQICRTGEMVAYARGSELYAIDVAKKHEKAITRNAKAHVTRGQADFNGQEEFDEVHGFWWSPDCKQIAYLDVDESAVKEVPVVGYRKGETELMMQRYPLAGGVNPSVVLHVTDVATGSDRMVKLPSKDQLYMGRVKFAVDSSAIYFEGLPRSQKEVSIYRADLKDLNAKSIYRSKPFGWAEMGSFDFAKHGREIVVTADRMGHDHLVVIDAITGQEKVWLTNGDWDVTKIARVSTDNDIVYFIATKDEPIGRQLYAISAGGGAMTRITRETGTHDVAVGRDAFIDVRSSSSSPPVAEIDSLQGEKKRTIDVTRDADIDTLGIRAPTDFTVAIDRNTKLFGQLLVPRDLDLTKKYPLIWVVYGGPGVQTIQDRWSPRLLWQSWADRGFFVAQVDNRGGSGRGQAFATPISGKLGEIELQDQIAALDQVLQTNPAIDKRRVGIYGHSYGGFMTLLAMFKAPDRFRAGVSGSPVTDFRLYDSGYTERYLGQPSEDVSGYDGTNVMSLASNLEGRLFLIHAMMDENVHFENAADLIDALTKNKKDFDLLALPGERHGYRDVKIKAYVYKRITDFFIRELAPEFTSIEPLDHSTH